jgi:hypothetical protein
LQQVVVEGRDPVDRRFGQAGASGGDLEILVVEDALLIHQLLKYFEGCGCIFGVVPPDDFYEVRGHG